MKPNWGCLPMMPAFSPTIARWQNTFEAAVAANANPKQVANWVTQDVAAYLNT